MSIPSVAGPLALSLDYLPRGGERDRLGQSGCRSCDESGDAMTMPPLLLALICERSVSDAKPVALFAGALERSYVATDHDALRRIARAAAIAESEFAPGLAQCYASLCLWAFRSPMPLPWPRRTVGTRLRMVVLVDGHANATAIDQAVALASLPPDRFDVTLAVLGTAVTLAPLANAAGRAQPSAARTIVGRRPGCRQAHRGPRSRRHDRSRRARRAPRDLSSRSGPRARYGTLRSQLSSNVAPLIDRIVADAAELEDALRQAQADLDSRLNTTLDATATAALWVDAVRSHQQGDRERALADYARLLAEQPDICASRTICMGSYAANKATATRRRRPSLRR
jgi:hypothetical protein